MPHSKKSPENLEAQELLPDLIHQSNSAWEALAPWWDAEIENGDPYHRYLIFPHVLRLLEIKPGQKILDFACGNGALSRRMAALGAHVVGIDVSEAFIQKARERSKDLQNLRYQKLDATSEQSLLHLAQQEKFNTVICSMALHDIPTLEPLIHALPKLLTPGGMFIFTVPHPCFNSGEIQLNFFGETPSITRSTYIKPQHLEMHSKKNQPIKQHMFHRSLSELLGKFFSAGFVLDAFEEPAMGNIQEENEIAWKHLPEIPPALICRLILRTSNFHR
jgi:2-polyprenyl-3-methyl-5-hydroxy-6-metoxy-1,4-benzoquinol methylase